MKNDTIAAVATAMSPSGIGIIRISGDESLEVIDRIYRPKYGHKKLSMCRSHTIHYGYIYDDNEIVDEVMVLLMKSPNSYTREDTVEIDCHGGVYVIRRVLETVIKHGARPADPGEFTKRAFLNGRIDLTQAESVMDVINAKNEFSLKSSLSQLSGSICVEITNIRKEILHEVAFIESALDDPEHINIDSYQQTIHINVDNNIKRIEKIIESFDNGRILKEGINTVIVGKPNAGKSSILNMLVGQNKAIVTDIAGTTRDIIEEQINLNGIILNLVDTAGIRETNDIVEQIGVEKAFDHAKNSDLILYVIDASTKLDKSDEKIIEMLNDKQAVILFNKTDLETQVSEKYIKEKINKPIISFSAKQNFGLEELRKKIEEIFFRGELKYNDEIYAVNSRQKKSLQLAYEYLKNVLNSIEEGMPEDFYTIDMMGAYEELGKITGESVEDDLVEEIFSKFCMGK